MLLQKKRKYINKNVAKDYSLLVFDQRPYQLGTRCIRQRVRLQQDLKGPGQQNNAFKACAADLADQMMG
jgi:hypothetical protein